MAFKKTDIEATSQSIEVDFWEQWVTKLTKLDIKTLDKQVLSISKITKAKSNKGFSLTVTNHCLIWVWSNSKFGEQIKSFLINPVGLPCIVPNLNQSEKDFEFGFDDEIKVVITKIDERVYSINPINPKLP